MHFRSNFFLFYGKGDLIDNTSSLVTESEVHLEEWSKTSETKTLIAAARHSAS